MKLAVIGGGSWGTALSIVLAPRFDEVSLWVYEADLAARMAASRVNDVFLPGYEIPSKINVTDDIVSATSQSDIVLGVMPSRHARRIYTGLGPHLEPESTIVSATKGLENSTLDRISQVIQEVVGPRVIPRLAVLSGPTFAREVARGDPTAVVISSLDEEVASSVQSLFSGPTFRLYTNSDPVGVELAAALKNVIAIGAGICQGLQLGNNTLAALITRGLAEMTRLAVAMGGKERTLAGLAGLGDLVLTCSGDLSRNRKVGIELAAGRRLAEIVGSMRMIAEGVETCDAAVALGQRHGVDLPIIQQMHAVLHGRRTPRESLRELMERSLKPE